MFSCFVIGGMHDPTYCIIQNDIITTYGVVWFRFKIIYLLRTHINLYQLLNLAR